MTLRRTIHRAILGAALGLAAAFALSGCGKPAGTDQTLTFSILSAEDQATFQPLWTPMLDDLGKAIGRKVQPRFSSSYSLLVEAMGANQSQIGWFSAEPALDAVNRANAQVFARTVDLQGKDTYQSVVIVKKGSGITLDRILACDHTLNFGMGDPKSTSGTLAPMTYLFKPKGIDPQTCFKTARSAAHAANLFAVANGALDASTNNSVGLDFARVGSPSAKAAYDALQVVWTSPDLPESALVYRKDLDPELQGKIRDFFLHYGQGTGPEADRQRAIMAKLHYSAFHSAGNDYLNPVREMAGGNGAQTRRMTATAPQPSALEGALAPPIRPLTARLIDLAVFGLLILLLAISWRAVEMWRLGLVFTNSTKIGNFIGGFAHVNTVQPSLWWLFVKAMWQTLQMALWGTALAVGIAIPLGLLAAKNVTPVWIQQPVRRLLDLTRSVPDLVIGYIFVVAVGLGPFAGVLALAINTGGVLAKLFSEAVEQIDPGPVEGVRAVGAGSLQTIVWGVLPQVAPLWTSFSLYRFEANARSATVLGLIGAGGIGQNMIDSLNGYAYDQTAAIMLIIIVAVSLIDLLSQALRSRLL